MKLQLAKEEVEALDDISVSLSAAREVVDSAIADYITVLHRARRTRDGIASRLNSEFERRSAKFRDSPAGDETSYYIGQWESIDLDNQGCSTLWT